MEFEAIARQYSGMLYRHIHRMVGNREDAQDVLQEVLLLIFRKLHTFRGDASMKTWVFRIASNRSIDFIRQSRRQPTEELTETISSKESPLAFAQRQAEIDALGHALEQLPTEQRQVVVLKEINGLTFREIAEILQIPENTAKTRMYTSLKKLRGILAEKQNPAPKQEENR
ncbi:MAG: RNA polymerase sigma factor [Acidobacteria bacterium]|nr:RNA polymerase sigma factor [Acidobacteriota bacterium]